MERLFTEYVAANRWVIPVIGCFALALLAAAYALVFLWFWQSYMDTRMKYLKWSDERRERKQNRKQNCE